MTAVNRTQHCSDRRQVANRVNLREARLQQLVHNMRLICTRELAAKVLHLRPPSTTADAAERKQMRQRSAVCRRRSGCDCRSSHQRLRGSDQPQATLNLSSRRVAHQQQFGLDRVHKLQRVGAQGAADCLCAGNADKQLVVLIASSLKRER